MGISPYKIETKTSCAKVLTLVKVHVPYNTMRSSSLSSKAVEVVVGKLVDVEVVLGLLASIHHEPGGMRRRVLL